MKNLECKPSTVASKIIDCLHSSCISEQEIFELVSSDQNLVEKILQVANTTYYSMPGRVKDLTTALKYVSILTIIKIALLQ